MKRLVAILCALFWSAVTSAETILVFDGSNSMWGELNGSPKIDIAQEAISTLLDEWNPSEPLGLVAYGHREARSCTDIEVLAKPGSTFGQIRRAVRSISPQGRTPLTGAVISASRTLIMSDADDPTLVLLTDGVETCNQDPCEVARMLKKNRSDFVAHVIGFDLLAGERASVSCLATETGGTFLEASNARELDRAMLEIAQVIGTRGLQLTPSRTEDVLQLDLDLRQEAPIEPEDSPEPVAVPAPIDEPEDIFSLLDSSLDELLASAEAAPVQSTSPTTSTDGGLQRSQVLQERVKEQVAQSLVSDYAARDPVAGTTVFAFGSAEVRFAISLAEGLDPTYSFDRPRWTIYDRVGQSKGQELASAETNRPIFEMSVGDYWAVLEADNVMYNYQFSVTSTLPSLHVITLNLGELALSVREGEQVEVYAFRFEKGPENPSLDLVVQGPWSQTVLLPRGTYIVQGRTADRRTTVGPMILEPGERVTADIVIR